MNNKETILIIDKAVSLGFIFQDSQKIEDIRFAAEKYLEEKAFYVNNKIGFENYIFSVCGVFFFAVLVYALSRLFSFLVSPGFSKPVDILGFGLGIFGLVGFTVCAIKINYKEK